mmetsp:Transcript_4245/g.12191  ORF Transcript_4245/g.12191 Transcript_4245/m.12191 type:complete len:358 (+) Transcript_4245:90-1163(+)
MMKLDGSHRGRTIGAFVWCLLMLFRYETELQSVDGFNVVEYHRISRRNAVEPSRSTNLPAMPTIRRRQRGRRIRTSRLSSSNTNGSVKESTVRSSAVAVTTTTTTTTAAAAAATASLNPVERWCTTHMNVWYDKSLSLKCPFFRRRTTDLLDGLDMVMRFLIIRHKSLPLIGPPPGCRSAIATGTKHEHLEIQELVETIRRDWKPHKNHKGYYITGRLNTTIYRDDCWFEGPDPDMPVRGVRKYLNAASQLFDTSKSSAELLDLYVGDDGSGSGERGGETIVAHWKLQGVLHLPWHPSLPTWTGRTVYHLDEDRLIHRHEEHWDISVLQAFTQTLWPELGNRLWNATGSQQKVPFNS